MENFSRVREGKQGTTGPQSAPELRAENHLIRVVEVQLGRLV